VLLALQMKIGASFPAKAQMNGAGSFPSADAFDRLQNKVHLQLRARSGGACGGTLYFALR
jgi:hypothetical protein